MTRAQGVQIIRALPDNTNLGTQSDHLGEYLSPIKSFEPRQPGPDFSPDRIAEKLYVVYELSQSRIESINSIQCLLLYPTYKKLFIDKAHSESLYSIPVLRFQGGERCVGTFARLMSHHHRY